MLQPLKVLLIIIALLSKMIYSCREGQIRLADGLNSREGRLEMCDMYGYWSRVAVNGTVRDSDAQVVCRELGFCNRGGSPTSNQHYQWLYYGRRYTITTNCTGDEFYLRNCSEISQSQFLIRYFSLAGITCLTETPNSVTGTTVSVGQYLPVRVSWSPPDMSGCKDIDEYIVRCHTTPLTSAGTVTTYTSQTYVTLYNDALRNSDFRCCVSGNNSAGEGPGNCASRPSPSSPRSVTVTPLSYAPTSLRVRWTRPANINGVLYRYTVRCGTQSTYSYSGTYTLTVTVTGLNVFTQYSCCVSVNNYVHESMAVCGSGTTSLGPPSSPNGLMSIVIQATLVTFAWDVPAETYDQQYNIILTCSEIANVVDLQRLRYTSSRKNYHTFSNLQPGATYECCIVAENAGGASPNTCTTIHTHEAAPSEYPRNLQSVLSNTSIATLSWEEVPYRQRNGIIRGYNVTICAVDTEEYCFQVSTNGTQVSTQVPLHPNYKYNCSVSAYTAAGQGPYSDSILFRMPEDAPSGPPQNIGHEVLSHSSVRLFWSAPLLRDRNGDITGYSIQVLTTDNTTYSTHEDVEERKLTVESLKEHTSYMFQVSAMTSVGRGPYKAHGPVTTAVDWRVYGMTIAAGVLLLLLLITIGLTVYCLCRRKKSKLITTASNAAFNGDNSNAYSGQNTIAKIRESKSGECTNLETSLRDDTNPARPQASNFLLRVKNWFKREKAEECETELPPIPMRHYLEDDQFMRESLQQPSVPKRYREESSMRTQGNDEEPALPPRVNLNDEDCLQNLEKEADYHSDSLKDSTVQDKEEEKIYQPLIPPRRYEEGCEEEESVYQGLTLNRSKDTIDPSPSTEGALQSVNNSEGHYQPLLKQAQPSVYETITLHKNNSCSTMATLRQANNSEGHYQPLMKREETGHYQSLIVRANGSTERGSGNNTEGHYQALIKQREPEST